MAAIPLKIHERIRELRKEKGITQETLARAVGVTNQAVSKWEQGKCCPDIQYLPELADYFSVSIDDLFGHGREERPAERSTGLRKRPQVRERVRRLFPPRQQKRRATVSPL